MVPAERRGRDHRHALVGSVLELADAADQVANELAANRMAIAAQPALLEVARGSAQVERGPDLSGEVILAQIRSIVADLLRITGMGVIESSDAIPPVSR